MPFGNGAIKINRKTNNKLIVNIMTRNEAIAEMQKGNKVTHDYFSDNEWMTMKNGKIVTEEGYKHNANEFWSYRQLEGWNKGYSLIQ